MRRLAFTLRSGVVNAPPKAGRALAHVLWAVASWARRRASPDGLLVQVTHAYVELGAAVGRRPAEWALTTFRRWTRIASRAAGWLRVEPAVLEATWQALDWIREHGLLSRPEVAPSTLEMAFGLDLPGGKLRGKARCGCATHAHGDRDPSLLFDLRRGLATCVVSGEVFAIAERTDGVYAFRITRGIGDEQATISAMINKDTPVGGVEGAEARSGADPAQDERTSDSDRTQDAEQAGRPGPDPRLGGVATGRIWPSGRAMAPSSAASRESWAGWQARRWGGGSGEALAWSAMAWREAHPGESARTRMPERVVGVGWWRPSRIEWVEGPSGRRWPVMEMEERGTGHVLFDIDGCDHLPGVVPVGLVEKIRAAVDGSIFDGISWVVRTSGQGVQVLVRLRRFRWDVQGFYRSRAVRRVLQEVGERIAAIVGGRVDPSVWRTESLARAPGWRVREKGGATVERAVAWYIAR